MTQTLVERADLTSRLMVGLEIHVELATCTKMFTGAGNVAHPKHYDAEPNSLCDPVVVGMPGTLPVINRTAVELSIRVGLALGCKIAKLTRWDRKSYYYPDLPKNYQISQYEQPLCCGGVLEIPIDDSDDSPRRTIRIIRAHLEEDAGKLLHEAPGGRPIDYSIVDLNRAGTPLLEIVTHPEFETADEVVRFCQILRSICRHLGVSEAIMQRGHMRFEPNINVIIEKGGKTYRTPIVEVKNLNSFKAVHAAVCYEHRRQVDQWLQTGAVAGAGVKSTRGWDDQRQVTLPQREKEEAHDYRYFPDPDLVPVEVSQTWVESIRARLPTLPTQLERHYRVELGLATTDARALIEEPDVSRFFDRVLAEGVNPKRAAAILLNYGAKRANERTCLINQLGIEPAQIGQIVELIEQDKVSSSGADELFGHCCEHAEDAQILAQRHGLLQVSDTGELDAFVDQVLAEPKMANAVADVRAGKDKAIGALIGQVMKKTRGQANPKIVSQLILEKLR